MMFLVTLRWKSHLELLCCRRILGAIEASHSHIGSMKCLGHQGEDGLRFLAVAAPWSVEQNKPLALVSHIDEPVTELQNPRGNRR